MFTFRRPPDIQHALVAVAVLFPSVVVADDPPLQRVPAVPAAYLAARIMPMRAPFPLQLFIPPDEPIAAPRQLAYRPIAVYPQAQPKLFPEVMNLAAPDAPFFVPRQGPYRPPPPVYPQPQPRLHPDTMDLVEEDADVGGADAQRLARSAFRPYPAPYQIPPLSPSLFSAPAAPDDPPAAQPRQNPRPNAFRMPTQIGMATGLFDNLGDPLPPPAPAVPYRAKPEDRRAQGLALKAPLFDALGDPLPPPATDPQRFSVSRAARFSAQSLTLPPSLFDVAVTPDDPALQSFAQQMARAAWREALRMPLQGRGLPPGMLDSTDSPPLSTTAQAAYWAAYRKWMPPPLQGVPFNPSLITAPDDPPIMQWASRFAQAAFRPYVAPPKLQIPFPTSLFLPDDPPLRTMAQQIAQLAYRPPRYFAQSAPPPPSLYVPQVFDDPPLRLMVQQLAAAAYRYPLLPWWLYNRNALSPIPFEALFPAAAPPTPSPIIAATNATALTGSQVTAMRAEIADLKRTLRQLIAVLEKKGLKI